MRILNCKNLIFSFSLLFALSARADKYMFSFGGAGDGPKDVNIFTDNFTVLDKFAKDNGWHRDTLFDGAQPAEKTVVASFLENPSLPDFTSKTFKKKLEQIQADLKSGKIKAGDQVMIAINTHGAEQDGSSSHKIVCTDKDCDMALIEPVLRALEKANVSTALLDLSCYSGQTLAMASDKTCVITGADNDVSFGPANLELIKQMKPGHSLEEAFLKARVSTLGIGNMHISSPAGKNADEVLSSLAKPAPMNVDLSIKDRDCQCSTKSALEKSKNNSQDIMMKTANNSSTTKQFLDDNKEYDALYKKAQELAYWINEMLLTKPKPDSQLGQELKAKAAEFDRLTRGGMYAFENEVHAFAPLQSAALKTQKSGHKLYDELYRSDQSSKENPCAKFKF